MEGDRSRRRARAAAIRPHRRRPPSELPSPRVPLPNARCGGDADAIDPVVRTCVPAHRSQSLYGGDKVQFTHILRVLNTNIEGRQKIAYGLTSVKGCGRRYAAVACKKAGIDIAKRAGELTTEELERLVSVMQNPREHKIPDWFLNRQKDVRDGTYSQALANALDSKLRDDLERLKKIKVHRGLRHFWGVRVRGQHTKTTGRRGRTVGVSKKK